VQVQGWLPPVWLGCVAVLAQELVMLRVSGSELMSVPDLASVLVRGARLLLGLLLSVLGSMALQPMVM